MQTVITLLTLLFVLKGIMNFCGMCVRSFCAKYYAELVTMSRDSVVYARVCKVTWEDSTAFLKTTSSVELFNTGKCGVLTTVHVGAEYSVNTYAGSITRMSDDSPIFKNLLTGDPIRTFVDSDKIHLEVIDEIPERVYRSLRVNVPVNFLRKHKLDTGSNTTCCRGDTT